MSRQKRAASTPPPPADSHVLKFVSRAEQLQLRGRRNFDRYMRVIKKYVAADSAERVQWQQESAEESERDAAWNRSHGPIPGGASILPWRDECEDSALAPASAARISG